MSQRGRQNTLIHTLQVRGRATPAEIESVQSEVWSNIDTMLHQSSANNKPGASRGKLLPVLALPVMVAAVVAVVLMGDFIPVPLKTLHERIVAEADPVQAEKVEGALVKNKLPLIPKNYTKVSQDFQAKMFKSDEGILLNVQAGKMTGAFLKKMPEPLIIKVHKTLVAVTGTTFSLDVEPTDFNLFLYEGKLRIMDMNHNLIKELQAGEGYSNRKEKPVKRKEWKRLGKFYDRAVVKRQGKKKPKKRKPTHSITLLDGKEFKAYLYGENSKSITVQMPNLKKKTILKEELQSIQPLD